MHVLKNNLEFWLLPLTGRFMMEAIFQLNITCTTSLESLRHQLIFCDKHHHSECEYYVEVYVLLDNGICVLLRYLHSLKSRNAIYWKYFGKMRAQVMVRKCRQFLCLQCTFSKVCSCTLCRQLSEVNFEWEQKKKNHIWALNLARLPYRRQKKKKLNKIQET